MSDAPRPGPPVPPDPEARPDDELARARREIERQRKVIAALTRRVQSDIDRQGGAFGLFASAIALEEKVRARTHELAEAKEAAEAAARAKAFFLANMSHEIRTPLNAVIGLTDLLLDSPMEAQQSEFVRTIHSSGQHLLSIINDILDFSKIEADKLELEHESFELLGCVETALALVASRAAEKGLHLRYDPRFDGPLFVLGDTGRLRQVLINLLANAVKFTERGHVTLTVEACDLPGDRSAVRVEVRDTGEGIPPERIGRLFESFSQVDVTTTRVHGGTGLGLAISQRLVGLMHSRIEVESAPGQGSRFWFTIAFERDTTPRDATEPVSLRGRRVLVLDDDHTNVSILEGQLLRWGASCETTDDPRQALEWAREGHAWDVAILDDIMPGVRGSEVAHELARLRPELPTILLTSDYACRLHDTPAVLVIHKPVKPNVLRARIERTLNGDAAPIPEDVLPPPDPVAAARFGSLRILVAEDNPVNQKVARALLRRLGLEADVVSNGREACDAVRNVAYDVVLMDVQMPEMDGVTATRTILAEAGGGPRPRIVGLTANATEHDRRDCFAAGMEFFLPKPVTLERLRGALEQVVATREDERAA